MSGDPPEHSETTSAAQGASGETSAKRQERASRLRFPDSGSALWWAVAAAFAVLFAHGLLSGLGKLGIGDWDYHRAWALFFRKSVFEFGQWPVWNPFHCGGAAAASNPSTRVDSPSVLFTLLLGDDIGIRVWPMVVLALGFEGARRLAVALGAGPRGALLAALIIAGNGGVALHLAHGHFPQLPFILLPWWLLGILRSWTKPWEGALIGGLAAGLICLEGGLYPLAYAGLLVATWSVREAILARSPRPLIRSVLVGVASIGMAAAALLPMAWSLGDSLDVPLPERIPLRALPQIFFGWSQPAYGRNPVDGLVWGWHEYGTYVGLAGLVALVVGTWQSRQRRSPRWWWLGAAAVFFLIGLGAFASFAPWSLLHHLPVFAKMRASGRAFQVALICLAMAAAPGFDRRPRIANAILVVLALDLARVAIPMLYGVFIHPEPRIAFNPAVPGTPSEHDVGMRQILDDRHRKTMTRQWYSTMTADVRANIGIIDCYDRVVPKRGVRQLWPESGEATIVGAPGEARVSAWSPAALTVQLSHLDRPALLVVNQNYHPGWEAAGHVVTSYHDVIAVGVEPADHEITLRFDWPVPWVGVGVSVLSVLGVSLGVARQRGKRAAAS